MKTTIKEITPQWASRILETRNPRNRPLSEKFVSKLARDIQQGAFVTTHQGIAFDINGDLIDGQHRLAAVVMAKKPITIPVTTGIQNTHRLNGSSFNTFEVIDAGRARGVGQMLAMAGFSNGNKVAACTKLAVLMAANAQSCVGISTAQAHKALMYFGKSVEACVTISGSGKIIRPQSWIVAPIAIYHASFPEKAEQFLRDVSDVTGEVGSPARALSTYSRTHGAHGGSIQIQLVKAAANAVWNYHNGKTVSKLYGNDAAVAWLLSLDKALTQKLASIVTL